MTLTELEIAKLAYPFRREEHDFLQGFVYISEESIGERIEKIDSEWSFNVDEMTLNGDSAVVRATLTIRGISRSGIGGNPIQREKEVKEERNGKWVGTGVYEPLPLYTQADNGVNAFKSAATDAFKRCARLFGIGRYLLSAPKEGQFDRWLKEETAAAYERLQKLQGEPKTLDTQTGEIKVEQPRPTPAPLPPQPAAPTPGQADASPKLVIVDGDPDKAMDDALGIVTGELEVSEVEVKLDKKQKPYLTFRANNVTVTAFSRDALRGVLDDATLDDLKMTGTHKLPTLKISYRQKEGFNNLVAAELKGAA